MATIKDIAEKAGVSISSVSRVLRGDPTLSISKEKRKIILQVAEELSYEYKVKRLKTEPVLIINNQTEVGELENLHYFNIQRGIEKRAKEKSLNLLVFNNKDFEINNHLPRYVSGIIAIGKFQMDDVQILFNISDNIVFVDSCPAEGEFDAVIPNYYLATTQAINYMINKGHCHIGLIGQGSMDNINASKIYQNIESSFYYYMYERNLLNESYIYLSEKSSKETGYFLMKKAIEEHGEHLPTAFFVSNDYIATGCIRALHEAEFAVPARVNVIGMNNLSVSNIVYPPLSTVHIFPEVMGETAVDLLLERLNGRRVTKTVQIATKIIKRESSF